MNNHTSSDYDQTHYEANSFLSVPAILLLFFVIAIPIAIVNSYCRRKRELSYSAADDAGSVHVVIQRDGPAPAPVSIFRFYKAAAAAAAAAAARSGCAVCLGDYKDGEVAKQLPECGHVFHRRCIDPWLMIHPTCPICRNSAAAAKPPAVARPAPVANQ